MSPSDEILWGWDAIRPLWPYSDESFRRAKPTLRRAGIVAIGTIGRPPNRRRQVWTYRGAFQAYVLMWAKRTEEEEKNGKKTV